MTITVRRLTAFTLSLALASAPLPAFGQTPPPPPPPTSDATEQAGAHYTRGVKLYEEDDFRAALIEFNRAYELAPNWAVLYNLGQAYYQLREYPNALRTLEKYVEQGGSAIAVDRRAQVDREIAELQGRVAKITMRSNEPGADILLDDAPIGKTPSPQPFVIGAGRHTLTVAKPGFATATKVLDIAGGDAVVVELDLTPPVPVAPSPPRETANYTLAIVSGVVAVGGIGVGAVFGVLAMNDKSSLNRDCSSGKICPASSQSDIDSFSRNGIISTVGFGVGASGLLAGTYFFFHERGKDTGPSAGAPTTARRATITPWLGPGSGGIVGTF